jgi:integrase/recombinase XerD
MNWNDAIKDFNNYLKIERGFSVNSIYSYEKDVKKFKDFINESKSPIKINSDDIKEFLNVVSKLLNSSSQSRIISGLRSFFEFLIFEKYITQNPLRLIESPKISRKLPDTLSTKEIDELISNIDLSKDQG